jgi:RHS repeat-associated protein
VAAPARFFVWGSDPFDSCADGAARPGRVTVRRIDRMCSVRATDAAGVPTESLVTIDNDYDEYSRVTSQTLAGGDMASFDYQPLDPQTNTRSTVVTHAPAPGVAFGAPAESVTYISDAAGSLVGVDDGSAATARVWQREQLVSTRSRRGGQSAATFDDDVSGGRTPTGVLESTAAPDPVSGSPVASGSLVYCQDAGEGGVDGDVRLRRGTDAAGVVTEYSYSAVEACGGDPDVDVVPVSVTSAVGTSVAATSTFESSGGLVARAIDADGVVREFGWDAAKRLLVWSAVDVDGDDVAEATTWYGYDAAGRRVVERSPEGWETWRAYDSSGRVTSSSVPVTTGRPCSARSACAFPLMTDIAPGPPAATATFWVDGRLLTRSDAMGATWTFGECWPAGGGRWEVEVAPERDGVRARTDRVFDSADRLRFVRRGEALGYGGGDAEGLSLAQCAAPPAAMVETVNTYGFLGRLESSTTPEGVVTRFGYDADGNVTQSTTGAALGAPDATSTATYDLRGRVVAQAGPAGDVDAAGASAQRSVEYVYDNADRVVRTDTTLSRAGGAAEQATTWVLYDDAGRHQFEVFDLDGDGVVPTHSAIDHDDVVNETLYTPAGRVRASIEPPVDVVGSYDFLGNGSTARRWWVTGYDPAGRATDSWLQTDSTGVAGATGGPTAASFWIHTRTGFDADGVATSSTAPSGAVTNQTRSWDAATSEMVHTVDVPSPADPNGPGRAVQMRRVDAAGRMVADTDWHDPAGAGAVASRFGYTPDGLLAWSRSSIGDAYDADGDPGTDPEWATVRYNYDVAGNRTVRSTWHQANEAASPVVVSEGWGYDGDGRVVAHWDHENFPKTPVDPSRVATTYSYDARGRLDVLADPSGRQSTHTWRNDGLLAGVTHSVAGQPPIVESFSYDAAGRRKQRVDATGTSTWAHDRAGNIVTQQTPRSDGTTARVDYRWSMLGQPRAMVAPDGAWFSFKHQQEGTLNQSKACVGTPAGDPRDPATAWSACPLWTVVSQSHWNADRQLTKVSLPGAQRRSWSRAPNGSGAVTWYSQWVNDEPNPGPDPAPPSTDPDPVETWEQLTYDPAGRLVGVADSFDGETLTVAYDAAGQVVSSIDSDPAGHDYSYSYAPRGERLESSVDGTATTSTYNADAELTQSVTGPATTTFGYDPAGRRTSENNGTDSVDWTWDAAGRNETRTACDGASCAVGGYTHNADGQLTVIDSDSASAGGELDLTWDVVGPATGGPPQVLDFGVGDATIWRAAYGIDRLYAHIDFFGTNVAWYAYDRHGSAIGTEAMALPDSYSPYGEPENATSSYGPFSYRGELAYAEDEIHLRNRDYQPSTGTFTTRDPLDSVDGTTTVANPYHYTDNDPLNKVDPLGLRPTDDCGSEMSPPYFGACSSRIDFQGPTHRGFGKVVIHFFIKPEHDGFLGVEARGDNRNHDPNAQPWQSRVHVEYDFETGKGYAHASPTCFWPTTSAADCLDARSWSTNWNGGKFLSNTNGIKVIEGSDGSMELRLIARDPITRFAPAISACFTFSAPDDEGFIHFGADTDKYPWVSVYRFAPNGGRDTLWESDGSWGLIGLARPYCW